MVRFTATVIDEQYAADSIYEGIKLAISTAKGDEK